MSGDIDQFLPAGRPQYEIDREAMRELRSDLSDEQFDDLWHRTTVEFELIRERVENPRRRLGGPCRRAGPVLFAPVQYLHRDE